MALSVTTVSPTRRLTTRTRVKNELEITATTWDTLLDDLLDQASSAIVAYCNRPFAREVYSETAAGHGGIWLTLARTPVVAVATVTFDGTVVITDYSIDSPGEGTLYRRLGWADTAQRWVGLSYRAKFLDFGYPIMGQDDPLYAVAYTAGYLLPEQNLIDKTTLSVASADNSFNDSASGFPATLKAGDIIEGRSWSNATNNGRFKVTGTPTTAKVVVDATLTTEAAGTARTVIVQSLPNEIEKACVEAVKAWYAGRIDDANVVEKQVGPMRVRYAEGAGKASLPSSCVGLLRPWIRMAS